MRERLLDAADSLLFIQGAFATPVDTILKRAGASPPSLYAHFGNKEGLIAAALRRRLNIWTQVWDDAIAAAERLRIDYWSASRDEVTAIDAAVEQLKLVTTVKEVRA